jgi:tRNA-(ms[2]io[6]A)-hydroxylase
MEAGPPPLQSRTDGRWLQVALADLDAVLLDHAHCEKKAALSAMSLVSAYPHLTELVSRCVRLAQEELRHFQQVHERILERGLRLGRDFGDPYAQELARLVRSGGPGRLTDRLLVCSLIEARSCERLDLLASGLNDQSLAGFYRTLARAEAGHFVLFTDLARFYDEPAAVEARLLELAREEAGIVAGLPIEPRIH